jgi:hypothetical protein
MRVVVEQRTARVINCCVLQLFCIACCFLLLLPSSMSWDTWLVAVTVALTLVASLIVSRVYAWLYSTKRKRSKSGSGRGKVARRTASTMSDLQSKIRTSSTAATSTSTTSSTSSCTSSSTSSSTTALAGGRRVRGRAGHLEHHPHFQPPSPLSAARSSAVAAPDASATTAEQPPLSSACCSSPTAAVVAVVEEPQKQAEEEWRRHYIDAPFGELLPESNHGSIEYKVATCSAGVLPCLPLTCLASLYSCTLLLAAPRDTSSWYRRCSTACRKEQARPRTLLAFTTTALRSASLRRTCQQYVPHHATLSCYCCADAMLLCCCIVAECSGKHGLQARRNRQHSARA